MVAYHIPRYVVASIVALNILGHMCHYSDNEADIMSACYGDISVNIASSD